MAWCFLVITLTAALSLAAEPAAADLAEIKARGVLRVLRVDAPSGDEFFSLGADAPPGFDREILDGFATLHRLKLEPVTVPSWADLAPALLQRWGDVAAGRFTITPARAAQVSFTVEVFPTRHVVVTRKPAPVIRTLEALRAQRLAAVPGGAIEEAILAAGVPRANVSAAQSPAGGPEALRKSTHLTAAVSGLERVLLELRHDPELQLGMFLGPPRSLAYAVAKEDKELLNALNDYLENTRRSGTWNRLVVKYFGEEAIGILKAVRQQ
jgi:polar amino acid transport system substrate-binding protein